MNFEYLVLRLMVCDYLTIPATTCILECSFLLSACTDDPWWQQIQKAKFGGLQKLQAGYMDGWMDVDGEIIKKYMGDFDFDDDGFTD